MEPEGRINRQMEQEGGIMIDLKRCPFCKGMARFENSKDAEDDYITMLICNGCDIRTRKYYSEEEAIKAWNRRAECSK